LKEGNPLLGPLGGGEEAAHIPLHHDDIEQLVLQAMFERRDRLGEFRCR